MVISIISVRSANRNSCLRCLTIFRCRLSKTSRCLSYVSTLTIRIRSEQRRRTLDCQCRHQRRTYFQIDYTEPFADKHIIETGLKYILRYNASDNSYRRYNSATGGYDLPELDALGNPRSGRRYEVLSTYFRSVRFIYV